jgi:hypothetical protein
VLLQAVLLHSLVHLEEKRGNDGTTATIFEAVEGACAFHIVQSRLEGLRFDFKSGTRPGEPEGKVVSVATFVDFRDMHLACAVLPNMRQPRVSSVLANPGAVSRVCWEVSVSMQ